MTLRKSWLVGATSAAQGATALDGRLAQAGSYVRDSAGLVRAGVLGNRVGVVTARADMSLDVGDFPAVLTRGPAYGVTPIANVGVVNVALPASPASGSRWVRVYATQHDNVDAADTDNNPVLGFVAGGAAASPALPALPVGALPIARILQPANVLGTADCTVIEDFPMTAAAGGVVYFRDQSEANAFSCPDGQLAFRLDWGRPDLRQNGRWGATGTVALESIYRNASGYDNLTVSREGNVVRSKGQFANKGSVAFASGTQYLFGKIPSGFWPAGILVRPAGVNTVGAAAGSVLVFPNGDMKFVSTAAGSFLDGQLSLGFDFTYDAA